MADSRIIMRLSNQKPAREKGRFLSPPLLMRGLLIYPTPIWLFQKTSLPEKVSDKTIAFDKEKDYFSRIRCPLCKWQPQSSDYWMCADSGYPEYFDGACGTVWNTFETRGLCPGCNHQWRWTSCLSCYDSSLHEDWYADKTD